jgi:hypothetical protein
MDYFLVADLMGDDFCTRYDARKPQFPYVAGCELLLMPHQPPQPVERLKFTLRPQLALDLESRKERISLHPLARCLLHPPAAGTVLSGEPLPLRIVEPLYVRDGRFSQLLVAEIVRDEQAQVCTTEATIGGRAAVEAAVLVQKHISSPWPPPPLDEHIVAKIYDPLYADHQQDDVDPFLCVDASYAKEAAAYVKLASLHGGLVPRYYGSYTFDLHEPSVAATRAVRVILMEFVRSCTLGDLDPGEFFAASETKHHWQHNRCGDGNPC